LPDDIRDHRIEMLKHDSRNLREENAQLRQQRDGLERQVKAKGREIEVLKLLAERRNDERIAVLEQCAANLRSDNEKLRDRLRESAQEIIDLRAERDDLRKANDILDCDRRRFGKTCYRRWKNIQNLQHEADVLRSQNADLMDQLNKDIAGPSDPPQPDDGPFDLRRCVEEDEKRAMLEFRHCPRPWEEVEIDTAQGRVFIKYGSSVYQYREAAHNLRNIRRPRRSWKVWGTEQVNEILSRGGAPMLILNKGSVFRIPYTITEGHEEDSP
jgi:hypothetical protein